MKNNRDMQLEKLQNYKKTIDKTPFSTNCMEPSKIFDSNKENLNFSTKISKEEPKTIECIKSLTISSTSLNTSYKEKNSFETITKPPNLKKNDTKNQTKGSKQQKDISESKFPKESYPWTQKIHEINKTVFKNQNFRAKQEEVINSALSKNDVFVCMPTGGGKSLTFHIPAIISKGLTLVVMPLVSLIFDQVTLLTKLGVQVRALNSSISYSEQSKIYDDILYDPSVKILFLTPEKLSQSDKLNSYLLKLYQKDKLERLAVDEAHCVSQWGRDFRADYMKLIKFRQTFPTVPIIALTATATTHVREDICSLLGMKNPQFFLTSFNRPNLSYEVRAKSKKVTEEIAIFIKSKNNQSGLVYCISKKDCETVAKSLNESFDIKTGYYHADLASEKRNLIQQQWMKGEVQVLVATIAFGMGIDKKDCRFVIHFSLPKSLEGYYQESGRAGRDGKHADCILFFSYGDKMKQDFLITKSSHGVQQEKSFKELNSVINYCEDTFTCRRKMQLEYLGESFDSKDCKKTCDNCIQGKEGYSRDVTSSALKILNILQGPRNGLNTLLQIAGLLKGANLKKNEGIRTHEAFGALEEFSKDDIEKLLRKMVCLDIIKEKSIKNFKNIFNTVIEIGPSAQALFNGNLKVNIMFESKKPIIYVADHERLSVSELKDLRYNPKNTFSESKFCPEQVSELKERIELVVRTLARKYKKSFEEVLSPKTINLLCQEAPDEWENVPKEVLDEIKHFKEINVVDSDPFKFEDDLSKIDFHEYDLKRKSDDNCLPQKKLKKPRK